MLGEIIIEGIAMKSILSLVTLAFAFAITAPALAEDEPTTKADCEKVEGMMWDEASGKCVKK